MSGKKRIILIEDEEDIAALIKLHADHAGYKLHVEIDGINGFRAVEREKPDLVILDVLLPGENGLDVCRRMKNHAEFKNIPVIILSAMHRASLLLIIFILVVALVYDVLRLF